MSEFICNFAAEIMKSALLGILIPVIILIIAVLAMAFRPLFIRKGKYGKFPNTHVCKHKFKD